MLLCVRNMLAHPAQDTVDGAAPQVARWEVRREGGSKENVVAFCRSAFMVRGGACFFLVCASWTLCSCLSRTTCIGVGGVLPRETQAK